jgi:hypothetical protein
MGDYQVLADDALKLVRITVQGDVPKSFEHEIITEGRKLATEKGYGILCDVREASDQVTLTDWFHLPGELDVLKQAPTRGVRAAVLVAPDALEEYRFYEDVAANVGLMLKVFLDEQEAIAWMA